MIGDLIFNCEEDLDMNICITCKYEFNDDKWKPFYLPCADLICEKCLNNLRGVTDEEFSFSCPECSTDYKLNELKKIKYNKKAEKLLKKKKNSCNFSLITTSSNTNSPIKNSSSLCPQHKKEHVKNLYCFYHKKKICTDCLIEHQFSKCSIKNWTVFDSFLLVNELKAKFIKLNDLEKSFEDLLMGIESKLNDSKEVVKLDLFSDHVDLISKYNKIVEENYKNQTYTILNESSYPKTSIELTMFTVLCEKLKLNNIIPHSNCLKFVTNNFKIMYEMNYVQKILKTFPQILIYSYVNYNENPQFFLKMQNQFYIIENLQINETKIKPIETDMQISENNEGQIVLSINGSTFQFYDILIFDNLFQILVRDNNLLALPNNSPIKVLYFNDRFFVFDFLNFIDIDQNYLKITFKAEERSYNMYIKILKYYSLNEFVVDNIIIDTVPLFYQKVSSRAKIKLESTHFKILKIEKDLEINNGAVKVELEKGELTGKIETISYFRLIN